MKVKDSRTVALRLHPSIEYAMDVVDRVWRRLTSLHPIVTGLQEIGHSETSYHYGRPGDTRCRAFDIRTTELTEVQRTSVRQELRVRLPKGEFDVVWEPTHLHIEFDPKDHTG
jgi:hypothetical protein